MRVIMEPGDLFVDADGLAWIALHDPDREPEFVQFVWFTPASKGFTPTSLMDWLDENNLDHPESNSNTRVPISVLNQPFRLLLTLGKEGS